MHAIGPDRALVDAAVDEYVAERLGGRASGVLLTRVLDALLRENHLGLGEGSACDGTWRAVLSTGRVIELPVRPDGFLADHAVTEPWLTVDSAAARRPWPQVPPRWPPPTTRRPRRAGAAFTDECAQSALVERLTPPHRVRPPARGFAGLLHHEVAGPAGAPGAPDRPVPLGDELEAEQRAYAPEHEPVFPVRWRAVHRSRLRFGLDFTRPGKPGPPS